MVTQTTLVGNSFNTSYVSVQVRTTTAKATATRFQYILCFGSSSSRRAISSLLRMFQYILCFGSRVLSIVGCLFAVSFQYILCFGSSPTKKFFKSSLYKFQYILCFGSSRGSTWLPNSGFTVSIHPMFRFKRVLIIVWARIIQVSIHPMFRFKRRIVATNNLYTIVSIHPMFRFKEDK